MRRPSHGTGRRRGATLVEAAVTLSVFLTLIIGLLDLGIAVFTQHAVCHVARNGVRQAIVHGRLAPPRMSAWGPTTYQGTAADTHQIAAAIRPGLAGLNPGRVTLRVEWIDGDNDLGKRVRVTASTSWRPLVTYLFGSAAVPLSAAATMPIAH